MTKPFAQVDDWVAFLYNGSVVIDKILYTRTHSTTNVRELITTSFGSITEDSILEIRTSAGENWSVCSFESQYKKQ